MEKNQSQNNNDTENENFNANNAYSGSGTMTPGGGSGEAGKLSDYPDGNFDDPELQSEANEGISTNKPEGRSIEEATDPSKLSDTA
jgi:hypothetical protein